jgi:hypothetical protein
MHHRYKAAFQMSRPAGHAVAVLNAFRVLVDPEQKRGDRSGLDKE